MNILEMTLMILLAKYKRFIRRIIGKNMKFINRKHLKQAIGVIKQQDTFSFVWLDELHRAQSVCLTGQQGDIFSQLLPHLPQKSSQYCFIGAISPHLTWSKNAYSTADTQYPRM